MASSPQRRHPFHHSMLNSRTLSTFPSGAAGKKRNDSGVVGPRMFPSFRKLSFVHTLRNFNWFSPAKLHFQLARTMCLELPGKCADVILADEQGSLAPIPGK